MKSTLALILASAALAGSSSSQTIERVSPKGASQGYLITIQGTNLGSATHVEFTASVGGFVGTWTQSVPVESADDSGVTAFLPKIFAGWAPPGVEGSSPFGQVSVVKASGLGAFWITAPQTFYYYQGTFGFLENTGLGVTQPGDLGRGTITFDATAGSDVAAIVGDPGVFGPGAPVAGNLDFVMQLEGAAPGALPLLVIGAPGPNIPIADGLISLTPGAIFLVAAGSPVDANGDSAADLPIPASAAGLSVAGQWAWFHPLDSSPAVSSALKMTF